MTNFSVGIVDNHRERAWSNEMSSSPQYSPFTDPEYLSLLGLNYTLLEFHKGQELVAGAVLALSTDGQAVRQHELVIYSGLLMRLPHGLGARAQLWEYSLHEALLARLSMEFQSVELQFHPSIIDIRPYSWHNFGSEKPRYEVETRYTLELDLHPELSWAESSSLLVSDMVQTRRNTLRRQPAVTAALQLEAGGESVMRGLLTHLANTASHEEYQAKREVIEGLIRVTSEYKNSRTYTLSDGEGTPLYGLVFVWSGSSCYYLLGSPLSLRTPDWAGSAALWKAIEQLHAEGLQKLDLEGVNSPHRGWFKQSFGGTLKHYYRLKYPAC